MIKKTRFSSSSQQILRVDQETLPHLSNDLSKKMIADLTSLSSDAVLISDYGKGALSRAVKRIFEISKKKNIPVVIDPKGKDYSIYSGAF